MNNKYQIINEISGDLKIYPYEGECKTAYNSRVIYSALAEWIKISTLGCDILGNEGDNIGRSRKHLSNRAKLFLDNILELFPEMYNWFYPEDMDENPESLIIDRLKKSGEIITSGFSTSLALPSYEECIISKNAKVIRGIRNNEIQTHTGLTQLKLLDDNCILDKEALFEFYGVDGATAQTIWSRYIKDVQWRKRPEIKCNIFNKYSKVNLSRSWDEEYKLKESEISIYKENHSDYGVIKKINNEIFTSQFTRLLVDEYEIRRFMYALKSEVKNSSVAEYKYLGGGNAIELNLKSALPNHENNILLGLAWPKSSIKDTYNLIFSIHVWEFIKFILENLNIVTREVN